jgi:uncharacterized membrane protein
MSVYAGASAWNTEIDLSRVARPDSLLAFHVEPMLLLFVPLYAVGGDARLLLVLQAAAVALGALVAFKLGQRWTGSSLAGGAVALAYLLSPLGQWAVLSDFHTSTLAAPLLLVAVERLSANGRGVLGVGAAALALTAREDVGPVVVGLGLLCIFGFKRRSAGALLSGLGLAWTAVCLGVIRAYSGGVSPFAERYAAIVAHGPAAVVAALTRPADLDYLWVLALSGGWLGLFAPVALLPGLPSLALNLLSSSPWMASGRAHYSGLVLPFIVVAAAAALAKPRLRPHTRPLAVCLALTSGVSYLLAGAGPLGADYAPATVTEHARLATALAASIAPAEAVSASASLVPHVSRRARVYVFPAVLDADAILLDLAASPGPTTAGDVFLRVRDLLADGGWDVVEARDGLLLLQRSANAPPQSVEDLPRDFFSFLRHAAGSDTGTGSDMGTGSDIGTESPRLVSASLVPSPDGAVEPDGPRWVLRTTWVTERQLPPGSRLEFELRLHGQSRCDGDLAGLWWYPLERWRPGELVTLEVPNVPVQRFESWRPILSGFCHD